MELLLDLFELLSGLELFEGSFLSLQLELEKFLLLNLSSFFALLPLKSSFSGLTKFFLSFHYATK